MIQAKPSNNACTHALLLLVATPLLLVAPAHSQLMHKGPVNAIAISQNLPHYDVASIRLHDSAKDAPNEQSSNMSIHDDVFTASNATLAMIIEFAYDIKSDQISGLSGPVASAHFDIEAKVLAPDGGKPPKLSDSQLAAMIIPLLAERFHLNVHLQPKTMPVYELVVAKGGPKIKLSQDDINDNSWNLNSRDTSKILTGKATSMTDLAAALSDEAGRAVIDKTGLAGRADITLKWTDEVAAEQGGPNVVSIFTAVEEQLGLKLQPAKGPVETLVIDHAEMPSAD